MYNLTQDIIFIGADDDNLDLFEAQYPLVSGISYNSFFINDEKAAIVDAVDIRRQDIWLANLSEAVRITGKSPDYLIIHHMEPDHSGGIKILLDLYPDIKIICTGKAADMLANFFEDVDFSDSIIKVADGDKISLGKHELKFITAPMV
ncbi:MAG: MBL fold metallo-hydrolase, partial [Muribaculaceae bacterium]|nr:MBL fold metallo-hydrolase [Muribaculaceae bacterium]